MNKMIKKMWVGLLCSLMTISSLQAAGWTPPVTLSNTQLGNNSQYDPSNRLLVTWVDNSTFSEIITAAFLSPLGVLSPAQVLDSPGFSPTSSVNPVTGDAVVAWIGDNATQTIETAIYTKLTDTWTTLGTLYTAPIGYSIDDLAGISYDASGNAVVLWHTDDGMGNDFFNAATFSFMSSSWGPVGTLPLNTVGLLLDFTGAVPKNGAFAVATKTYQNLGNNFQVSRFSGSTWTTQHTEVLPIVVVNPGTINNAIDNSGNIALTIGFDDGTVNNFAYAWGTGEPTGEVITPSPLLGIKGGSPVVVDNNGRAYTMWYDSSLFAHAKNFLFLLPTGWSQDATTTTAFVNPFFIAGAPDANGNLSVAFNDTVTFDIVQEATFTASSSPASPGTWSAVLQISDTSENNDFSNLGFVSNPSGAVLLSWGSDDGMGNDFVQEVHKASIAASFTPIVNVVPLLAQPRSFISNAGNKALTFAARTQTGGGSFLTVFIDDTPVIIPPNPPTNFIGQGGKNKFLTQTERFNGLTWTASTTPTVVSYLLFRNGELVAVIPATGPLLYVDHNRNKHVTDTYTLYAVDASGAQSAPATVVVH